ncbi:hypothetical protein PF001_g30385 [Phytophthora fragariae]|uniref:Uncharacterized protein n=1 Tax=Phytophthora fragariae TaxID=53985 RepID=A0A6A4B3Y9_9STRA|nr:hypothetical protein PF003_g40423 [Phytophthora fragariae]KAE9004783.1 hypothetical protein PF011_g12306 [Phytophthora fragariae]KAE9266651.1 hypothetical protein PF001_g30385 [Phytophthora fragariae]
MCRCLLLLRVLVMQDSQGARRPRGGELQSRQKRKDRESRVQPIGRLLRYAAFRLR